MSPAELIDKASILRVKMKRLNIDLSAEIRECLKQLNGEHVELYLAEMETLNERGWELNEVLFESFDRPEPTDYAGAIRIVRAAREAHRFNMARIVLKNAINETLGCPERERKSWL